MLYDPVQATLDNLEMSSSLSGMGYPLFQPFHAPQFKSELKNRTLHQLYHSETC